MSAASYNRGSRAIRARIDRELAEKNQKRQHSATWCAGRYRNGPDKKYARCNECGHIDYEANEGDKCRR